jgi:hypothetical protein
MGNAIACHIQDLLLDALDPNWRDSDRLYCFDCMTQSGGVVIWDRAVDLRTYLPYELAVKERLNIVNWYSTVKRRAWNNIDLVWKDPYLPWIIPEWLFTSSQPRLDSEDPALSDGASIDSLDLFGIQVPRGSYVAIERNATLVKDFKRPVPKPIVVVVHINGHPARALLDTGSLADFMSSNLAEQLNIERVALTKPLTVKLAVQGSRSKVNFGTKVRLEYQGINCDQYFDIANLQNYDLILGTPFLFQHKVMLGFNDTRVIIGSGPPQLIRGPQVQILES